MRIAFIPVRGGSKSIPGKNIRLFCGKPLIWWNLVQLQNCPLIDEVIVATDDLEIKNVSLSFCFSKVKIYWRDEENARDVSSTESVMLEYLSKSKHHDEDLFILVQATSPFTKSEDFEKAYYQLVHENSDSLLTTTRFKRFIWSENGMPLNYDFKKRPRRQDFSGMLVENGSFYMTKVKSLIENKNRLSGKISTYIMEDPRTSIEIDDDQDWIMAESLMEKRK
jgi:CMP-N-acetylneuraminic acid synthetase